MGSLLQPMKREEHEKLLRENEQKDACYEVEGRTILSAEDEEENETIDEK